MLNLNLVQPNPHINAPLFLYKNELYVVYTKAFSDSLEI